MADYDLEALSLKEVKQLQLDVVTAISTYQDRQKAEARAKMQAVAREMGYSLAELIGSDGKPNRVPAAPKYRPRRTCPAPGQTMGANRRGS